jgi:hypothetical protein
MADPLAVAFIIANFFYIQAVANIYGYRASHRKVSGFAGGYFFRTRHFANFLSARAVPGIVCPSFFTSPIEFHPPSREG